jgi:alpha-ketoglutarate-dependent 2,4-dichlorophenoxyacetate dioxygenase
LASNLGQGGRGGFRVIQVKKLHPLFVGEVSGVDLCEPVDAKTRDAIIRAWDEYGVLVFRDQSIDDEQQMAFTEGLGPLVTTSRTLRPGFKPRLDPRMSDISNLDEKNRVMGMNHQRRLQGISNRLWHTDNAFRSTPAKYSLLSARAVPSEGGETEFADMRAVYDALPEKTKAFIEDKVAVHSLIYSREVLGFADYSPAERDGLPPARHAMVRTHPGSGRKALYVASYAYEIEGMPTPEARMLLHDLIERATQRQFVYTHTWRVGDIVMWDNRCTLHRARDFDMTQRRDLHRTAVVDDGPTVTEAQVVA